MSAAQFPNPVVDWTLRLLESLIFLYFIFYMLSNVALILLSTSYCKKYKKRGQGHPIDFHALESLKGMVPPVTLVVPAYNEERVIALSVRSLLSLSYTPLEVVVVNDGSRDGTLDDLIRSFSLRKAEVRPSGDLPTQPIRGLYVSAVEPRLVVVDKVNGGKADTINAGINFSQSPYFVAMDSDTLFEREAVTNAMALVMSDPDRIVAVAGVVRGVNGSIVDGGRIRRPSLLLNFWVVIQAIEYLRSFLAGRAGWSAINGLLIVPGAFGLFQKAAAVAVGGFGTETVTEDFEFVLKLHRFARQKHLPWRIALAPDAVCWTEMPSQYSILSGQRKRWHEGLWQTLKLNKSLLSNPRYGVIGLASLPYMTIFEAGGPFIELLGLVLLPVLFFTGRLTPTAFVLYLALAFFAGTLFSLVAIWIDQTYFPRYRFPKDAVLLLVFSLIENFGYHQLYLFWRVQATWNVFFGRVKWRVSARTGFATGARQ